MSPATVKDNKKAAKTRDGRPADRGGQGAPGDAAERRGAVSVYPDR